MRVPPTPFNDGYDVRGPKATRIGKESAHTTVPVFRQSAEGIGLSQLHTSLAGTRSLWSTAADDRGDLPNHDRMRACERNDDGRSSEWFKVAQGLRQKCLLSPLLFIVFFAAILFVALERFSKDAGILADRIHLQEQPSKVGPEKALECVRRTI